MEWNGMEWSVEWNGMECGCAQCCAREKSRTVNDGVCVERDGMPRDNDSAPRPALAQRRSSAAPRVAESGAIDSDVCDGTNVIVLTTARLKTPPYDTL